MSDTHILPPKEPTQVMLKAATEYSYNCHLAREIPSGKGYYTTMVAAFIAATSAPEAT